ncbi:MAG: adenylyltransferase/cytidyltransferase family protein [Alphaproteobacteria bacterium]|nr:adenylyltransferase/cytidyltransferase family protein [Alphaproteobacteria bacterium]
MKIGGRENKKHKIGLTVLRGQPFHIGHDSLLRRMLSECDIVVAMLGSAQEARTADNPFTVAERMNMIAPWFETNIANGTLCLGAIDDLGNAKLWAGYVLAKVWKDFGLEATAYYSGAERDSELFADAGMAIENLDRKIIPISASKIRAGLRAGDEAVLEFIFPSNRAIVKRILTNQNTH